MRPPRAREDLEVCEREIDGRQVYVVRDPALSQYHQLGALAFAVLEALEDGKVAVGDLPRELSRRHGIRVSLVEVGRIVGELERMALLEVTPAAAEAHGERPLLCAELGRLRDCDRQSYLQLQTGLLRKWRPQVPLAARMRRLRVRLFDPTSILERLAPVGRLLFARRTLIVAAAVALFALGIQLEQAARLKLEMGNALAHPLLFLAVALVVTLLHELGHGLACHTYGGRVHDLGVMLMYLVIPAAYCDVSDAHFIEGRWRRAVVALAGCYVNVILWALATLCWRVLAPELLLTRIALAVIGATSVSLFLNLNPLLPLDGYYALEELVGVQNLRQKNVRGGWVRLYRWCSTLYVGVIVPLAMLHLFRFLVGRFRLVGLLGFLVLAGVSLRPLGLRAWRWVMGS